MENLSKDKPLRAVQYQAVVAGVSAGGLEALKTLLSAIAADFALALVIVQHLHPEQSGFLVEHLDKDFYADGGHRWSKRANGSRTARCAPAMPLTTITGMSANS